MYDPRQPNVFSLQPDFDSDAEEELERAKVASKVTQLAEEQRERQRLKEAQMAASAVALGSGSSGSVSAEELQRRRLEISARLKISSAVQQQQEEAEALHQQQKYEGTDKGSKLSKLLASMGGGSQGDGSKGSSAASNLSAPLTLAASTLGAGGLNIVESRPPPPSFPSFALPSGPVSQAGSSGALTRSRPSTVVRLTGVATEQPDDGLPEIVGQECRHYGHVRQVRVARSAAPLDAPEYHPPFVFVQFDTVASAFKAAEALKNRPFEGRKVTTEFYPLAQFEASVFDHKI